MSIFCIDFLLQCCCLNSFPISISRTPQLKKKERTYAASTVLNAPGILGFFFLAFQCAFSRTTRN